MVVEYDDDDDDAATVAAADGAAVAGAEVKEAGAPEAVGRVGVDDGTVGGDDGDADGARGGECMDMSTDTASSRDAGRAGGLPTGAGAAWEGWTGREGWVGSCTD